MATKDADVDLLDDFIPRKETWKDFLYNSDKGTVLGRTGLSWLKITIFYIIFYCCLVGWFAGLLHAFYSTLDDVAPKHYGNNSLLQDNPALGVRPMPIFDSTMIRFSLSRRSSYQPYTDHLDAFFKTYAMPSEAVNCTGDVTVKDGKGCNIDVDEYLAAAGCKRSDDYGYKAGEPCVVLKMNKLYGFIPNPYGSVADIVKDLKTKKSERFRFYSYAEGNVGVSCDGQNEVDAQHLKGIQLYPTNGLDKKFFPYLNQKGYRSPIILAKFTNITKKVTIQVNCKLWALNIDNSDGKAKKGTIHFEFYIN